MKNLYNKFFTVFIIICSIGAVFSFVPETFAAAPVISAASTGSGDNVLLSVTGDPNSSVILNYLGLSSSVQMSVLGNTNSSGIFSITVSTATYGITPGSLFYVTVNNQRSDSIAWPYASGSSGTGTISLSQTSLSLAIGQSASVSASNNNTSSLFLSSNSSPSVANITINGNQFTVSANTAGSTTITVCSLINSSNCASLSVTVQSASVSPLTFNQNNISITSGQTVSVVVAGGTGSFTISSNSNPNAIQASINGSTINLYANSSSGSSVITVCSSNMSSCGVINATAVGIGSSALSFSQSSPVLSPGQVTSIVVSGSTGTYYISSNSNSGVVQANLVNNTLTLFGNSTGASLVTVCSSTGNCGTVTVNVTSSGTLPLTLNPTSLSLTIGQISSASISGSGNYLISGNNNPGVASAVISGSNVTVTAISAGTDSITICANGGQCAILSVTVSGQISSPVSSSSITFSQVLSVGQGTNLLISGGTTPYSLSQNTGSIFTARITNGGILTLYGISAGTSSINVCSANGSCATISVMVVNSASTSSSDETSGNKNNTYKFTIPLTVGSVGEEVTQLQERLTKEGVYSGPITGYYGALTEAAVEKYQTIHGLNPLGNVGPGTRAMLNGE